jgi:hypothetical protein
LVWVIFRHRAEIITVFENQLQELTTCGGSVFVKGNAFGNPITL